MVSTIIYTPTRRPRIREGRGFSLGEIKRAGLTPHEAKRLGIYVDKRRKTLHPINVQTLKGFYSIVTPLTKIRGIGEVTQRQLINAGILDAYDLAHAEIDSLVKVVPQSKERLKKWQDEAKKLQKK